MSVRLKAIATQIKQNDCSQKAITEERAARLIQFAFRSFSAEQKRFGIRTPDDQLLFKAARNYLKNRTNHPLQRTIDSLLLFKNNNEKSRKGLELSIKARAICGQNHYDTLLITPSCRYKSQIVTKKLLGTTIPEQMRLYRSNPTSFDQAVNHFASFFFQHDLRPLSGNNLSDPILGFSFPSLPRYDNVTLVLTDKGKGVIGLSGWELFESSHLNKAEKWNMVHASTELIYLFPHHFEQIIAIAKQFYPDILDLYQLLKTTRAVSLSLLETFSSCHSQFLNKKEIQLENRSEMLPLPPSTLPIITRRLRELLEKNGEKEDLLASVDLIAQEMVSGAFLFLSNLLRKQSESNLSLNLLSYRTLSISSEQYQLFQAKLAGEFPLLPISRERAGSLIFESFVDQGAIAFFHPDIDCAGQSMAFFLI